MMKKKRGGFRAGSGRPPTDRKFAISVRVSKDAFEMLAKIDNKSEYIDNLIKQNNDNN